VTPTARPTRTRSPLPTAPQEATPTPRPTGSPPGTPPAGPSQTAPATELPGPSSTTGPIDSQPRTPPPGHMPVPGWRPAPRGTSSLAPTCRMHRDSCQLTLPTRMRGPALDCARRPV
jgi:hypothetical protein